jgi:hypothetical protein
LPQNSSSFKNTNIARFNLKRSVQEGRPKRTLGK